jgi:nitroreductase
MDLYEGIMTTRAIRRFSAEPVTDAEIEACLAAAQQAPSGGNSQPWQYVVITDDRIMAGVRGIYLRAYERWEAAQLAALPPFRTDAERAGFLRGVRLSRRLAEHLDEAAALVLFCMPQVSIAPVDDEGAVEIGPLYASVYPAVQNLMLAARSMGIGSVLTTVWWSRQEDVRSLLGIPDRYEIVALVPLGRPAGAFGVAPRRPHREVTHWQRWSR